MINTFFAEHFPFLGKFKRYGVAWYQSIASGKSTYSQHSEDKFIWEYLKQFDLSDSVYVDVGANHPSSISNTYLLYRNGLHGIIIEPNEELVRLFQKFRKRDTALAMGCGNSNTVLKFNISKTPVISSFAGERDVNVYRSVHVPVMRLDDIMANFSFRFISFLSIDVEGLNHAVLEGAKETLKKSLLVCFEYETEEEKQACLSLFDPGFHQVQTFGCNIILENISLKQSLSKSGK